MVADLQAEVTSEMANDRLIKDHVERIIQTTLTVSKNLKLVEL